MNVNHDSHDYRDNRDNHDNRASQDARNNHNKQDNRDSVADDIAALAQLPEEQYASFHNIEPAKQERIIQAALELFATQNYAQVSTNQIVKNADISKGLLFHYFGNKEGLYAYLQHHVVTLMTASVLTEVDVDGGDIFDVLWNTTKAKMYVAAEYPLEAQFYTRSFIDTSLPPTIRASTDATVAAAFDAMEQITQNLDEDLLKEGLEKEKVAKIVDLVCTGITNEIIAELNPGITTEYWREQTAYVKTYFDFMRQLFYKEVKED